MVLSRKTENAFLKLLAKFISGDSPVPDIYHFVEINENRLKETFNETSIGNRLKVLTGLIKVSQTINRQNSQIFNGDLFSFAWF